MKRLLTNALSRDTALLLLTLSGASCTASTAENAGTGGTTGALGGASSGGIAAATGGNTATSGGAPASGGALTTGGTASSGGTQSLGGAGGALVSGGVTGTGGAASGSGGASSGGSAGGSSGGANAGGSAGNPGGGGSGGTAGSVTGGSTAGSGGANGGTAGAAGSKAGGAGGSADACGSTRPSLSGVTGGEGLVIAPDGTIYFSQPFAAANATYLGRYKPPYTQIEKTFVDMKGAAFGIAHDPKRNVIYAGSRTLKQLVEVRLTNPPTVSNLVAVEAGINGVTLAADGSVYYSDQTGANIYRVTPPSTKVLVTTSTVADPNGVAFGPDGQLYVLTYGKAAITRLKLTPEGTEASREPFATITGGSNADGIAFDAQGRLYVTAGGLFRISADGKTQSKLTATAGSANLDFGVGALGCNDLYSIGDGLNLFMNDTPGASVTWHHAP